MTNAAPRINHPDGHAKKKERKERKKLAWPDRQDLNEDHFKSQYPGTFTDTLTYASALA